MSSVDFSLVLYFSLARSFHVDGNEAALDEMYIYCGHGSPTERKAYTHLLVDTGYMEDAENADLRDSLG